MVYVSHLVTTKQKSSDETLKKRGDWANHHGNPLYKGRKLKGNTGDTKQLEGKQ